MKRRPGWRPEWLLAAGLALAIGMVTSPLRLRAPVRQNLGQNLEAPPGSSAVTLPGQTTTLMPDGSKLLLGGLTETGAASGAATQIFPGSSTPLSVGSLNVPRAWHTATLLPDGTVLVLGGIDAAGGVVNSAELFNPASRAFSLIATPGITPRAYHTATVLTGGTVLVAGGIVGSGEVVQSAEIWNPQTQSGTPLAAELSAPRRNHGATLLPDGTVLLWGGTEASGQSLNDGDLYDPETQSFTLVDNVPAEAQPATTGPSLAGSIPEDGSQGVSVTGLISVRFSERLSVTTVNSSTVTLSGPAGNMPVTVVPAEAGMLAFATPTNPLLPGATYTLSVSGLADSSGRSLPQAQISFTTAMPFASGDGEAWIPNGSAWRTGRPDSRWQHQPPLQAPPGTTAISGTVLKLNGLPLPNVTLQVGSFSARSDSTGRFLLILRNGTSGHSVLVMNGATANTYGKTYGLFQYGMDVKPGITNVLGFTIWMPLLDTAHAVTIPSPTKKDTVITTPLLPGLELLLPAGTVIWDYSGRIAHTVSITPIPLDRTPFPLPSVQVPIYFTIQPGGAWLSFNNPNGPQGAQLFYPNTYHNPPGTPYDFWNYDATGQGWYVYGLGKVSPNGQSIVPNPGVFIYGFTGAMIGGVGAPPTYPPPCDASVSCCGQSCGDPIDLGTGLFVYTHTDLSLPDVIPLSLTRTYRQGDPTSRAFGIGTAHPYDIFLWSPNAGTDIYLILPDGGRIHFTETGSSSWECTSDPTSFYGATITEISNGWSLKKKDGTALTFPIGDTAQTTQQEAMTGYQDRYGNVLTLTRDSNSNLTEVASPNGRYIQFTLDYSGRITQATDNIGRVVKYLYDSGGRLTQVTDANGGITYYAYDSNNNMLTVKDPRGFVSTTNQYTQYGSNYLVTQQTEADGSVYKVSYTLGSGGNVTQSTETDPLKNVRQVSFDSNGYKTSDTLAVGTPQQEATTFTRNSSELISDIIDPLNRDTHYTYDSLGNTLSVTQLYNTSAAVTTSFMYAPTFSQVTQITDPLGHMTNFTYDGFGNLITLTDPLLHQWAFTYNTQGQPLSATDPLSHTTSFLYDGGALASVTDPLLRNTTLARDGAGRLVSLTDPLGTTTQYQYDALNNLLNTTDPLGNVTSFAYDADSDLTSLTDANKHATSYTYDSLDRLKTRRDPLTHSESYTYDLDGNLATFTDRKGQKTTFTYDLLNRRTKAAYADASSTTYTYDLGNRLTQAKDSVSGTINRSYDGLDRLTQESTPQGSVSYKYDNASRRIQMTVAGQPAIGYGYDSANRLIKITQGSSTFGFSYDKANRRTLLTLANGVSTTYGYDQDSELTGLTYKSGSTTLGNLTYSYDLDGRRTSIGGTYARTGLPAAVSSASYNQDNQLTQWGSSALTYDLDGNLTNDSTNTYTWNARNQLASINSGTTASFQYDAFSRRQTKTIFGTSTSFLYDAINPVQELAGEAVSANLVTSLAVDEILSRADSAGARYFLADGLRGTLALTDSSGAAQTQYTYEPFGSTTVSGESTGNSFQFTGRENDSGSIYFYRARYYAGQLARFVDEDPIGLRGGVNFYAYVHDSPVNFADPLGLYVWLCTRPTRFGGAGQILNGIGARHAYLWDDTRNTTCGMGEYSGVERPQDDTCVRVDGSQGKEALIMGCCMTFRNAYIGTCQGLANQCLSLYVSNPPKPPGGLLCPTCN